MNIQIPCFPCTLTILFYRNVILFNFIVWGRNLDLSGLSNIMWLCEWHLDSTIVFLHSFYFHSILYFLELQLYLCVVRITIKILFYILEPTNFTSEGNQENPKNQFHTPISRSHLEFAVVARCRELCPGVILFLIGIPLPPALFTTNSTIHKVAGLTVPGHSMICLVLFHHSTVPTMKPSMGEQALGVVPTSSFFDNGQ